MNTAIISLGSNIDSQRNIEQARKIISKSFHVLKESEFIQTKPIGYTNQEDFINGAVLLETEYSEEELKQSLKKIEKLLGRKVSTIKFGPRTIDLDIIVWNNKVVDQDFYERDFIKNSVLELIPNFQY